MKQRLFPALIFAGGLVASTPAVDAYSSLGAGPNLYATSPYAQVGERAIGFQFTSAYTGPLDSFGLGVNNDFDGGAPAAFVLNLYEDSGSDTLGNLLGSWTGLSTGVPCYQTTSALAEIAAGASNITLQGNGKYWITVTSKARLMWNQTSADPVTYFTEGLNGEPIYVENTTPSAFAVRLLRGEPVPEPGSLAALTLGASCLWRNRRRR